METWVHAAEADDPTFGHNGKQHMAWQGAAVLHGPVQLGRCEGRADSRHRNDGVTCLRNSACGWVPC